MDFYYVRMESTQREGKESTITLNFPDTNQQENFYLVLYHSTTHKFTQISFIQLLPIRHTNIHQHVQVLLFQYFKHNGLPGSGCH